MNIIRNKVLKTIIITYVLSILLGVITYFFIDVTNINGEIINYFKLYNNNFNYINGFINNILYNLNYSFIIWVSGILIIGIIISPISLILKGLSFGITLTSIIVQFRLNGLILALILLFSNIILYDMIYILLTYYSINLSLRTYKTIKNNQQINIKLYYKNYIIRYLILISILIITSLFDTYIISNIIKYIII